MTPWQRVHKKFGMPTAELARRLGRDRSKVYRHLNDPEGLISGPDQKLILAAAQTAGVEITAADLVPVDVATTDNR